MGLCVVIGGQYGGEGKGSIAAYLAHADKPVALVKTGGPNSAHTFGAKERLHRVRMVPSGTGLGPELIVFPAGCLVHVPTLLAEIAEVGYAGEIAVDANAGIVDQACIDAQHADAFYNDTGSTRTGTGAASALRARRRLRLASQEPALAPYLRDTARLLQGLIRKGARIVVEGAQGYGLSNYHGQYPYVTSRDCTLGAALSQIGLGPRYVDEVFLVIKCFPTRNSEGRGALPGELDLTQDAGLRAALLESGGGSYTTKDIPRRVGLFDAALVERAVWANSPTALAVTGLDRLAALEGHPAIKAHYGAPRAFLTGLARQLGIPVALEGWGPAIEDVRDHRRVPAAIGEHAAAD